MSVENQWLSVHDIAELLQVKEETVRRWIRRGELPVLELGGPRAGYRVRREDVDHFIWQRYRMRHQDDTDQHFRDGYRSSYERSRHLMNVRVARAQDETGAEQQVVSVDGRTDAGPGSDGSLPSGSQQYLSLLSRIPGITYVSMANPETGESIRRHIAFVSTEFETLIGETSAALRESDRLWWDRVHAEDVDRVRAARRESYRNYQRLSIEYRILDRDGQPVWVHDEAVPGDGSDASHPVWQGVVLNVSARKQIEERLQARVKQHAVIAELGEHALSATTVQSLFDEAVVFVQSSLEVDCTKVLELLPGGDALSLRAGVGWQPGLINVATVSAGAQSQAGYTLLSNEPVIVRDLPSETRFNGPPLLLDHGIASGLSVIIAGTGKPWGVLGAHSKSRREFTHDDVSFLQSVANILASAIRSAQDPRSNRRWLSIHDVAETLRVKDETVRRWIRRGELPVIDLGSSRAGYRVHPADLDQFIEDRFMTPDRPAERR